MADKHVFSSPDGLVLASLKGSVALNPTLRLHPPSRTVYVTHPEPSAHIAVVAGGGAGHEPAHAGFTGHGMLTASVSGDIFASPSAKQILSAILFAAFAGLPPPFSETTRPRDVLVIINNYTGDRLNFGLAIERARALHPNLNIASVLNADDVSLLPHATNDGREQPIVGPRDLAGNILVCKILGAYTTFGAKGVSTESQRPTFVRAKRFGDALVANLRSVGAALGHCHVPGRNAHSGTEIIEPGYVELGLGLHNEPGVRRASLSSPTWLVSEMTRMIRLSGSGWMGSEINRKGAAVLDPAEEWIRPGDATILFLNNLGGISQLELGATLETVRNELATHGVFPVRIYSAPFMTSLNAPGFSISLVNVTRVHALVNDQTSGDEPIDILALLDAPTDAYSWVGARHWFSVPRRITDEELEAEETLRAISHVPAGAPSSSTRVPLASQTWEALGFTPLEVEQGIRGACNALLEVEGELTKFDTAFGDGDCGETFSRGARSILSGLDAGMLNVHTSPPAAFLEGIGELVEETMGGTIGAIFSIFFSAWSTATRTALSMDPALVQETTLRKALTALSTHTPARPGDRTIVDALVPLCTPEVPQIATKSKHELLEYTNRVVKEAAESTRHMRARFGRAVYVGRGGDNGDFVVREEFPDPGAWGLAALVDGFVRGVQGT